MEYKDTLELEYTYKCAMQFGKEKPFLLQTPEFLEANEKYINMLHSNNTLKLMIFDLQELAFMKGIENVPKLNLVFYEDSMYEYSGNFDFKLKCQELDVYFTVPCHSEYEELAVNNLLQFCSESCVNSPKITLYITNYIGSDRISKKILDSKVKFYKIYYKIEWDNKNYTELT